MEAGTKLQNGESDIRFACIHCGQKLACAVVLRGQCITCPACCHSLVVPRPRIDFLPDLLKVNPHREGDRTWMAGEFGNDAQISIPKLSVPDPTPVIRPSESIPKLHAEAPLPMKPKVISALAVVSFALSLLGPIGFFPAIVCGHIARWRIQHRQHLTGITMATTALAIAYSAGLITAVLFARTVLRQHY